MDGSQITSIDSRALLARLGTASAPILVDLRRPLAFSTGDRPIVGAFINPQAKPSNGRKVLPRRQPIVVYCVHGHDISQGVARELRALDLDAVYLEDGS